MSWARNKRLVKSGGVDLWWVPRDRCGWDCTLAALAYRQRRMIEQGRADLNEWAVQHGLAASARYGELGHNAIVLWHGTSVERAEKIVEHGLFHKGGLWATLNPRIAHGSTRARSIRFGTEGATLCLVLDGRELVEGANVEREGRDGEVYRFHHGLPPDALAYVLMPTEIRLCGQRAKQPKAWPIGRFVKRHGRWTPMAKPPVRYNAVTSYSTVGQFVDLCVNRLLDEQPLVSALEVFSVVYALVQPWDAVRHEDVLEVIERRCAPHGCAGGAHVYGARGID